MQSPSQDISAQRSLPTSMRQLKKPRLPDHFKDPPRKDWIVFEDFFASQGMVLWTLSKIGDGVEPPDARIPAPDAFLYRYPGNLPGPPPYFVHLYSDLCPARTSDGRDVMIRIISIGDDGIQQRTALERLSTGYTASAFGNHCIPILQWLHYENITFSVFPMLSNCDPSTRWAWEDVGEVLDSCLQMLEAVAFCHSKLVVHRDLFSGNFLSNFVGGQGPDVIWDMMLDQRARPLRSLFPFRIYLIDFEYALFFDEDPQTHFVRGRPIDLPGVTYARPVAPEMDIDAPYNPFKADVWQLGKCLDSLPIDYSAVSAEISRALRKMIHEDPVARPTAHEVLSEMRRLVRELAPEKLRALPPYMDKGE